MKIDRNVEAERISAVQATRDVAPGGSDAASAPVGSVPLVNLSNNAKTVQKLRDAVDQAPSTRSEKVDRLKQQMQDGTFEMDLNALADRLEGLLGDA